MSGLTFIRFSWLDQPEAWPAQLFRGVVGVTDTLHEHDELTKLAEVADELANAVDADAVGLSDAARAVVDRLRERRFDVAVVGEFNRGKSTLLNRLVDRVVLPSGVLPVTSIVTEMTYGDADKAHIAFEDGRNEIIDLTELQHYVTEEENPGNKLQVANARVTLSAPVLKHGAILVDTPGVGSIFRHNSELARRTIVQADGAIMVMSADTPMTEAERSLIKMLSHRSQKTFFVLNRIDHLEDDEVERVRWFVENVLTEAFGEEQHIYPLSARTGQGLDTFIDDFESFLDNGLDEARVRLAKRDVSSLADRVENECSLEESALSLSAADLDDKLGQFRRAADWQQDAFADDRVLFEHAGQRTVTELKDRLLTLANVSDEARERIRQAAKDVAKGEVETAFDSAIEKEVRAIIEPVRRREEIDTERSWRKAAERFERATQRRADKMREIAGELFEVQLHPVRLVQPAGQKGRFFYSAPVHEEHHHGLFSRLLSGLRPERRNRQRLLEAADQRFADELKRHADRLRDDLSSRINDANRDLQTAMEDQVTQVSHAMLRAIERAQQVKSAKESVQRVQRERSRRLREAAAKARGETAL